jgi:hypothetical protein
MVVLPAKTPTLLKFDGSDFPQPVAVQKLQVVYSRNYPEIMVMANNIRAFSEIGDDQDYIDSFTLETYSDASVTAIKQNVARESSQGVFTLRVPDLDSEDITYYLIRFFGDPPGTLTFSRERPRRAGNPALHVAEVTEIEVLDSEVV